MNTGASWSPDGKQIALTLSKDGNAEIYIISASDGSIVRRITNDTAIDTSPAWFPMAARSHSSRIATAARSHDSLILASSTIFGNGRVYYTKNGEKICSRLLVSKPSG